MQQSEKKETADRRLATDGGTAQLLGLCADQIKAALDEAVREVDSLSCLVLDSARHANTLLGVVSDQNPGVSPAAESILAESQALQQAAMNANMRLQFADRLNQRLSNVSKNLLGLAELMQLIDLPITDSDWTGFLTEARANYTMKQERQMFDAIFGAPDAEVGTDPATDASQRMMIFDMDAYDDC